MTRKATSIVISGILLVLTIILWQFASGWNNPNSFHQEATASIHEQDISHKTEFTIFPNDSLANFWVNGKLMNPAHLDTMLQAAFSVDVRSADFSCIKVIWDELLYTQRWDTLPQTKFWRKVMSLRKDSGIVNIASTRQIIEVMSFAEWESKTDTLKEVYRDSVRLAHALEKNAAIYITGGKKHYYHFDRMLKHIGYGIEAFYDRGVDPWYAQAILLIESPGQLQFSPVGAYGSFQLMKEVAIEQGLIVNDTLDEREDFFKSAWAAAGLIQKRCLPNIRRMLRKRDIEYKESDPFFRMLVLHAYHAGAGNVEGALQQFEPREGGIPLIQELWRTEYGGFKNASQNYSQVAIASMIELDRIMTHLPDTICQEKDVIAFEETGLSLEPAAP